MNASGLRLAVPWRVALAVALFFLINFTAICHMRGVADPEGYVLNTSKLIPVNTYEDDAQVSIGHALGLFGEVKDTFSIATNFGGPLLHAAKPVMWAAAKLGLIKRSPDRFFYVAYPEELLKIWQVFAVYKLCILLLLPLSLYWIGSNFISEATGTVAAWLVTAMPYITAFEVRLKPDGVVLALTLLAVLHLLEHVRSGRARNLYYATGILGLTFSMKFTLATAVVLLVWAVVVARRRHGRPVCAAATCGLLAKVGLLGLVVFCLGNVRFLENPGIFLDFITRYTAIPETTAVAQGFWPTVWFRLGHFGPFFGPVANVLVLPALLFAAWRFVVGRGRWTAQGAILVLFVLNVFYLWKVAHNLVVRNLTYYYYAEAVLALFLVAMLLGALLDASRGRLGLRLACLAGVVGVVAATFVGQRDGLAYLCGPSTRELAHAWIRDMVPKGTSVGVPLTRQDHFGFTDRYMVDPFAYRVVPVGEGFADLGAVRPAFVLAARSNPLVEPLADPAYAPLVTLDTGGHLPREPYNFYQDDIYTVSRLRPGETPVVPDGPGAVEAALGAVLRQDPEPGFNVASYRGLSIFPLTFELVRKTPETVLPLPTGLFAAALRDAASPVSYLHQVPPEVLTLWGVKYVLAKPDGSFQENVLDQDAYRLRRLSPPAFRDLAPDAAWLYANEAYRGQVFFLPQARPEQVRTARRRYLGLRSRDRLKIFGTLYPAADLAASGAKLMRVRLTVSCSGPMDLLLTGGRRVSVLLGPGTRQVDLPYAVAGDRDVGYDLHPAKPGASCRVLALRAAPLAIEPATQAEPATVGLRYAFARVDAEGPGEVVFALPWHPYWRAAVDGRDVTARPGPAHTVAVPVGAGAHAVSLRFAE